MADPPGLVYHVYQGDFGAMWNCSQEGLERVVRDKLERFKLIGKPGKPQPAFRMFRRIKAAAYGFPCGFHQSANDGYHHLGRLELH
jgi:hypothetical protein